jgi:uncharacterized membrane protein YczE
MKQMPKRLIMSIVGVLLCGVAVAMLRKADMGTDPYTVFILGIANLLNSTYHTVYIIMTGLLLIVTLLLDRKFIGIATVVNLFLIGVVCDGTFALITLIGFDATLVNRGLMLIGALLILCVASSLYFTADLGVSTYDAMALIAAKRKLAAFRVCRISTDLICVVVGFALGATGGIGTVLVAFCMGPLIQWLNQVMSLPLLNHGRAVAQ